MNIIRFFTGSGDPNDRRRAAAAALVALAVIIVLASFHFVFQVSAAGLEGIEHMLPTTPAVTAPVQPETEPESGETAALREALAGAEAERDALEARLADSGAECERLRTELETLRQEQSTVYVLRLQVERRLHFPESREVLSFTCTVDRQTYELWEPGDDITGLVSFLSLPDDGLLHTWTITLADKYIASGTN